jgi:prepilin-type N-terminal cleavage/methylation domain-containing protein
MMTTPTPIQAQTMANPITALRPASAFRQTGFSMVELMVTLAISGILLAMGIPAFQSIMQTNRVALQTNDIASSLNYARAEAVNRRATVNITSKSGGWANGWNVWVDLDGDTSMDTDEVLKTLDSLSGNTTLAALAGTTAVTQASFNLSGFLDSHSTTVIWTLTPDKCRGDNKRSIQLGLNGRVSVQASSC